MAPLQMDARAAPTTQNDFFLVALPQARPYFKFPSAGISRRCTNL